MSTHNVVVPAPEAVHLIPQDAAPAVLAPQAGLRNPAVAAPEEPQDPTKKDWIHPDSANTYATMKTFAQGFFDAALIASNAAQVVFVVKNNLTEDKLGYILFIMAILSICINVVIFVFLAIIAGQSLRGDKNGKVKTTIRRLNYVPTILIGLSLITNIIGAAFAGGINVQTNTQ